MRSPATATPGSRISSFYVSLITSGARSAGHDVEALLRRAGIETRDPRGPGSFVTADQFSRLLVLLSRRMRDEFWGSLSTPVPLGSFATMCRLLLPCRTLGEAVRVGCRFYHALTSDLVLRVSSERSSVLIRIDDRIDDPEKRRMAHGAAIFLLFGTMCWLVGRRIPVSEVGFAFPASPRGFAAARVYGGPVLFEQPRTQMRVDARWLNLPILPDRERLSAFLKTLSGALVLSYRERPTCAERVATLLRRQVAKPLSIEDAAGALCMSSATLRRRLSDEGRGTFQELKDDVRRREALRLLADTPAKLDDVARLVGFVELSTFHRAFRRWTGLTPGAYRRRARDVDPLPAP